MATVCSLILGLSCIGLLISVLFALASIQQRNSESRWVCRSVLETRYGRILGVPNWLVGAVYYLGLGAAAAVSLMEGALVMKEAVRAAAAGAALISLFLFYILVWRLKTSCPL